jgi:hypothetical protein
MSKNVLIGLGIFVLFLLATSPTHAQITSKEGFSVSPPSFDINARPGETLTNIIKIENTSSVPLTIIARPENFVAYGEGGQVAITEEQSTFAISKWITIDNARQTIPGGSFALFSYQIAIPQNAEPGSHYGAVVFSTEAGKTQGSGAALTQQIGSLILLKLPGNTFEKATLEYFKPSSQVFTSKNMSFNALVSNEGNVHIKPYGYITITNLFGQKVKTIEIKGKNILPGSKRTFNEEFVFENIGVYNAEFTLVFSGGSQLIKGTSSFVALNTHRTMPIAVVLFVLIVLYILLRNRFNKAIRVILKGS